MLYSWLQYLGRFLAELADHAHRHAPAGPEGNGMGNEAIEAVEGFGVDFNFERVLQFLAGSTSTSIRLEGEALNQQSLRVAARGWLFLVSDCVL
jgi:hypothetical protein